MSETSLKLQSPCSICMHQPVTSWGIACNICMHLLHGLQSFKFHTFTPATLVNSQLIAQISNDKNRLLKVCYVPATSASLPRLLFLLRPLTVLMKQTRQAVCILNQSILLRCLRTYLSLNKHWIAHCKVLQERSRSHSQFNIPFLLKYLSSEN